MAGDWQEVTVVDVASAGRNALVGGPFGSDLVSRDYVDHGVPVIRGQNMGDRWVGGDFVFVTPAKAASLAANIARAGDIVFTQRGTLGQVSLVPDAPFDRYLVSQSQMKLTVNRELADPLFFYYVFRDIEQQDYIRRNAIQTGVPHTNLGILRATPVPLPPIAEQRAIARILGTLDDKIELNRRLNETLEAIARALFTSWFVDFDPVRAKSEGRDPSLPPHLADLFPDSFEGSELGEIPKGWGTLRLGDLLVLDKGLSYKGQFLGETGMPMVNLGCFLGRGRFAQTAMKHYSGEFKDRHVVRPRDLLVANTDLTQKREVIGSPALIPPQEGLDELLFTHHVFAARFREGQERWKLFVYFSLLQEEFRERATGFATGTTVLALPRDAILGLQFSAPPPALIGAFGSMVLSAVEGQWKALDESATLATVRDTLLPKLFSGELRVKDAERIVAGAGV